jgi:hypothetical protein
MSVAHSIAVFDGMVLKPLHVSKLRQQKSYHCVAYCCFMLCTCSVLQVLRMHRCCMCAVTVHIKGEISCAQVGPMLQLTTTQRDRGSTVPLCSARQHSVTHDILKTLM